MSVYLVRHWHKQTTSSAIVRVALDYTAYWVTKAYRALKPSFHLTQYRKGIICFYIAKS